MILRLPIRVSWATPVLDSTSEVITTYPAALSKVNVFFLNPRTALTSMQLLIPALARIGVSMVILMFNATT